MRSLISFLLCLAWVGMSAQTSLPYFKQYRDKYLFVQKKVYDQSIKGPAIIDTLHAYIALADSAGDSELKYVIRLFEYQNGQSHIPADTLTMLINEIIEYAHKNNLRYLEASACQALAFLDDDLRLRIASMDKYIASYEIYRSFSGYEFPPKRSYLYSLGGKFGGMGDGDNALKYLKEASRTQSEDPHDYSCPIYNAIGMSYRNMKSYDSAIVYFTLCIERATKLGGESQPYVGIAAGNIGISYFFENKYDEALPLLKQDIALSLNDHQVKNAVGSMGILATIYNNQKKFDSAFVLLQTALHYSWEHEFWYDQKLKLSIYRQMSIVCAARKDFRTSSFYADSALTAGDSVMQVSTTSVLARAHDQMEFNQHRLEAEQLQNKVKITELELAKSKIITIASIIGVFVLLIVLLYIARLNRKITEQKKEVENLNDVKNKIFSVIGHDLRSPVNTLISFTQLLEHGNMPPEKLAKYVAVLKDNLGYTSELMENLLNWARSQMHGYKPVFERFDAGEIAHQAAGLLATEADKKKLQVVDNISKNSIVLADINMTSLILRNLLSNAVKFTPAGGTVTLWSETVKDKVLIKVKDTGAGITPNLVEEFNRSTLAQPLISTPGTNKEKGTGLGLMLCKNFALLMHGSIRLESAVGVGSTFTLELPAE